MAWSQKLGRKGTKAPAPGWQTEQWAAVGQYTKGGRKKRRQWAETVKKVTVATPVKKRNKAHRGACASGPPTVAEVANLRAPQIPVQWMKQATRPSPDRRKFLPVDCDNNTYKCRNFFSYLQFLI